VGLLAAAWLVVSWASPETLAQNYDNSKQITITPNQNVPGQPVQNPTVTIRHFEHAWVDERARGWIGYGPSDSKVDPKQGEFKNYGYEGFTKDPLTLRNSSGPPDLKGYFTGRQGTNPVERSEQNIQQNFSKPFSVSASTPIGASNEPAPLPMTAQASTNFTITFNQ
jgi:hypothetical protein